ncbi:MAG: GNAT family N-acetyltransferase [Solirubrobacterales bacterium]
MTAAPSPDAVELAWFTDLESRRELWQRLARRSRNVFATWEWAQVWWRHFGGGTEPAFAECRRPGGEPFAILPLHTVRRGPLRILRLLGHGPADVLGPVCDPADAAAAAAALRGALGRPGSASLLVGERLSGGAVAAGLGGRLLLSEANPRLTVGGRSWEDFVSSRSRNLREKLRRSERRAGREHRVEYRLCESPEELEPDLDTLFRLHRARWGAGTSFGAPANVAFHRDLAAAFLATGRLRLWTMTLDGEPAACWYGFRFERIEAYYQAGRDPAYDRLSVGFLMLARTLQAAFEDGLESYAFLRGDEPYKERFADADDGLETRLVGKGPLGTAMAAGAGAALRVAPLRRLLARRLL